LIAVIIRVVLVRLKSATGDKLVGSDIFGKGEYYLGMLAGMIRFACMALVLVALMHTYIVSDAEREATERMQAKNFEGVRFPTYGELQQSILFESATGKFIDTHLAQLVIKPGSLESKPIRTADSPGPKRESAIDEVLGAPPKKKTP
jgi:hypothetical protein